MLSYYLVNLWSKKDHKFREFIPPWYDVPLGDPLEGFVKLLGMAERENGGSPRRRSAR